MPGGTPSPSGLQWPAGNRPQGATGTSWARAPSKPPPQGHRPDPRGGRLTASPEAPGALTKPDVRCPAEGLEACRVCCESPWQGARPG
jgi:hypothetical protein